MTHTFRRRMTASLLVAALLCLPATAATATPPDGEVATNVVDWLHDAWTTLLGSFATPVTASQETAPYMDPDGVVTTTEPLPDSGETSQTTAGGEGEAAPYMDPNG